jgi:hypothetical protein
MFNVAGHLYGAYLCYDRNPMAAIGLCYVAVAATAGVFRFGFNREAFLPANSTWADLAGFVGLPLVGHYVTRPFLLTTSVVAASPQLHRIVAGLTDPAAFLSILTFWYTGVNAYTTKNEKLRDLLRTVTAFLFFVLPLSLDAFFLQDYPLLASVLLFMFGGVAVGADRNKLLFGVRRENWFHYIITVAAYGIGLALGKR